MWRFYTIPGAGRIRQRHVEGRQLEDRRRPDVADRQLRSRTQPRVLGGRQSRARVRSRRRAARWTTSTATRSSRSMPTRAQLKWHYQFTPDDGHDWDSVQDMVLVDRVWRGRAAQAADARRPQRALLRARPNEREVPVRHAVHLSELERRASTRTAGRSRFPDRTRAPKGSFLVYPTLGGGTNFQAPSYSPLTGWFYLAFAEGGQVYTSTPQHDHARPAVSRPRPCRRTAAGARPESAGDQRRHQSDRSGNRQDHVVVTRSIRGRSPTACSRPAATCVFVSVARRKHPRARREDRKIPLALPDGRQPSGVADELCDRRQAVRRARGRQRGLQLHATGVASCR